MLPLFKLIDMLAINACTNSSLPAGPCLPVDPLHYSHHSSPPCPLKLSTCLCRIKTCVQAVGQCIQRCAICQCLRLSTCPLRWCQTPSSHSPVSLSAVPRSCTLKSAATNTGGLTWGAQHNTPQHDRASYVSRRQHVVRYAISVHRFCCSM